MKNPRTFAIMKKLKNMLRTVLAVILTAALGLSTAVSVSLACMRVTFTNEYILEIVNSVDYADIKVPDGMGGFIPMADYLNSFTAGTGITFTNDDFNKAVRDLSLDSIMASFLQDCRAWIFDNAPRPSFNPDEMAQIVLGGLDGTMATVLSMMLGDQAETVLVYIITSFMEGSKLESRLDSLGFLCSVFSSDALAFSISVCAMIFVLLFVTCQRKILTLLTCSAIAAAGGGMLMIGADAIFESAVKNKLLLALSFPESTFDIIYRPVVSALSEWGQMIAAASGIVASVLIISMITESIVHNIRRRKHNLHSSDFSDNNL